MPPISDREALVRLLAEHCFDAVEMGFCDCGTKFAGVREWSDHLADLVESAFLVVPRSEIVGTEYARRTGPHSAPHPIATREDAIMSAVYTRRSGSIWADAQALERPSLPWSVIPLPEDGS